MYAFKCTLTLAEIALCGISASILLKEHSVSYEDSFPPDGIFVDIALGTGETLLH